MPLTSKIFRTREVVLRIACVCVFALCFSAQAANDRTLFWQLEADRATVYLLGSIHLADASLYPLRETITDAFETSEFLVVEADTTAANPAQMQAIMSRAMYPPGEDLSQHLAAETLSILQDYAEQRGIPLELLIRQKPAMLMLTLAAMEYQRLGLVSDYGIDQYFLSRAKPAKTVLELESVDQQFEMLLSLEMDDLLVRHSIADMERAPSMIGDLVELWKSGDAAGLEKLMIKDVLVESPELSPLIDQLIFRRNATMAQKIGGMIQRGGRYFVVVGAGHLVGEGSIVDLLKKAGFELERR